MNCACAYIGQNLLEDMAQLPDTDILFGIGIQKRYSQSYGWGADNYSYRGKDCF